MRAYLLAEPVTVQPSPVVETVPGMTLTETIDQFYSEGVVPDLLPADLGTDSPDEIDANGYPYVDPMGNIRSDPMELRERQLVAAAGDKFAEAYAATRMDDYGDLPVVTPSTPLAES